MAWDRDGTQAFYRINGGSLVQMASADLAALNNEGPTGVAFTSDAAAVQYIFIFPELRDLAGYYLASNPSAKVPVDLEVSSDTTNGIDGTWSTVSASLSKGSTSKASMRTGIVSSSQLGIRGIRFTVQGELIGGSPADLYVWHMYGAIASGENPNRLVLWHPTSDERIGPADLDWGDAPRGSSADATFRVKNLSATQTANDVVVALEALTDTTPSVPGQHTLSEDGSLFLAQIDIGDLAPGAISTVQTVRRITPTNATLSLWWLRAFATATSWT